MITNYKHYILSVLLAGIWTTQLWAQDPKAFWELSSDETTSKNYVAWDYVKLQSGTTTNFHFKAEPGKSFNARIDAGLLFPPKANTYALPNGTITTDPTQGAVVGSIPGSASVSPSGAATYQIPIELPSGINGMQPQVSVIYNSQGSFGALGIGWDISGVSAINRVPQSLYYDEVGGKVQSNSIQFNSNDRLALDGQRLILLNNETNFSTTAEYGTEIENYSRVKVFTSSETGLIYFVLTTKEGKVFEFGKTTNSLVRNNIDATDGKILSWKLNKVTDINGNYIQYDYSDNGQYLSKIDYTGTAGSTPIKHIIFNYIENVYNPKLFYIGNFQILQKQLLTSIVTNSNQLELKKYIFDYDTENRLKAVTEWAQGSEKLNSTKINWGSDNLISTNNIHEIPVTPIVDSQVTSSEDKGFIQYGDINGDGFQDRIELGLGTDSSHGGYINVYLYQ